MRWRIPLGAALTLFMIVGCDQNVPTAARNDVEATAPDFAMVQNDKVAWTWTEFNTCTGEWMDVVGTMHILQTQTFDAAGGVHTNFHLQPMGIKAVGRTTGMVCQANGPTQERFNIGPKDELPYLYTYMQSYLWICPGPDNNATAHIEFRVRVNANGELTVLTDNARSECLAS